MNRYGVAAATVNGVAMKLENICRIITDSMGTASSTMIAQCFGAGKLDRCRRTTRATFIVCFGYCAVCALVIGLFPRQVFSVFVTDAAVLDYAAAYAAVGVGCALGLALRATFCSVVTGVGNAALSMTIGIADGVVARIGLSLLLSAPMTVYRFSADGLFVSIFISIRRLKSCKKENGVTEVTPFLRKYDITFL